MDKLMSQDGRSEEIVFLRQLIARIEGGGGPVRNRASEDPKFEINPDLRTSAKGSRPDPSEKNIFPFRKVRQAHVNSSTFVSAALHENEADGSLRLPLGPSREDVPFWLDAVLGGGLKRGALYETVPGGPGDQTAACAFALGLAIRFVRDRVGSLIWVVEDFAAHEWGAPYAPGLVEWGLDPNRLVLVRTADARAALWAIEEALKCRACAAVVGELWGSARRYGQAPARRLVMAARKGGGASCFLLHPAEPGGALNSHGAQARFAVFAASDPQPRRAQAFPLQPRFSLQVLKSRLEGGRAIPWDRQERRPLVWNPKKGLFDEPLSVDLAALSRDRTHSAQNA